MREVKCYWCKIKSPKDKMICEEKVSGSKKTRKYFHQDCRILQEKDKEQKEQEIKEWDELYKLVANIHNLNVLDSRMIERLQDLRNGSIKINNKKITRYKQGVPYHVISQTYRQEQRNIEWCIKNKQFEKKWNEFAYCFSIVLNKINDVYESIKLKQKAESEVLNIKPTNISQIEEVSKPVTSVNRKDELDISDFL